MRLATILAASTLLGDAAVFGLAAPPAAELAAYQPLEQRDQPSSEELWKRKGGGGRGGGGGSSSSGSSGSSSSGSSGSSSSGSSSGSSGSSGSSSGSSSSGSSGGSRGSSGSTSNTGGRTAIGSGPMPSYGGGRFYGGGAKVPYKSGSRSPSGILPVFFAASFLAFWPGLWLYGAQIYPYTHPYTFFNWTNMVNETKPVACACDPYNVCGCDESGDNGYLYDLVGTGNFDVLNHTLITVATVNGTSTILINGTLPNGTTAAGGPIDPSAATGGKNVLLQSLGLWPIIAAVGAVVLAA